MTFWATCVVVKMVATHFRKPVVGIASGTNGWGLFRGEPPSSTCFRVVEFSNQKRHVIYGEVRIRNKEAWGFHSLLQPIVANPPEVF